MRNAVKPTVLALTLLAAAITNGAAPTPAEAADLRVHYRAIEKLLTTQLFQDEGRRYVQGSRESKCSYAYLEQPRVSGAEGRIRVRMHFVTLLGMEVRGKCLGAADDFYAVVSGVPVYREGSLEMADLRVETEERGYGKVAGPLLQQVMAEGFRFPLQQEIEKASQTMWEQTGVRMTVPTLEFPQIRVEPQYLAVGLDFRVVLR